MIDLPWITLVTVGLIVTLGYAVYGVTGFGASIVAVPLLAHFVPLHFAVPMMLIFDFFAGVLLGLQNRRHVDQRELLGLLPYLIVGMLAGVTLLVQAPEWWLLLLLGIFVLGYASWSLLGRIAATPISARWAIPSGLVGGALTALYGTGGPIYTIYLARRLQDRIVLRASVGVLIFGTALIRLLLFSSTSLYAQEGLLLLAFALLPCALVGYLGGSRLHAHLPPQRAIQGVWVLLMVGGASLLWRSVVTF